MRISDWSSDVCSSDLLDADAFLHRQADRAGLEHLGADAREFEHLLIGDIIKLAGASDDPRVGRVNTVNIGVDIAAVGLHRRRDRDRAGVRTAAAERRDAARSEEHTSELQSLMRISYAVFCLKKKKKTSKQ